MYLVTSKLRVAGSKSSRSDQLGLPLLGLIFLVEKSSGSAAPDDLRSPPYRHRARTKIEAAQPPDSRCQAKPRNGLPDLDVWRRSRETIRLPPELAQGCRYATVLSPMP